MHNSNEKKIHRRKFDLSLALSKISNEQCLILFSFRIGFHSGKYRFNLYPKSQNPEMCVCAYVRCVCVYLFENKSTCIAIFILFGTNGSDSIEQASNFH